MRQAQHALLAGRPADAIPALRRAAMLAPANPAIQHDLGLACLECGHLPEAIAALQAAVALNPAYADAHFRLGIALEKAQDLPSAIAAYDRATTLQPRLTEAWYRAGAAVFTLGHRSEAIGCFQRAAATGGKTPFGRLGSARALLAQDREAEAETQLRRLLALDPANALALELLGHLLSEQGRFDEAWTCFQRAIAAAPLMVGTYYDLVRCRRLTAQDEGLRAAMQAALSLPGLEAEQRLRLHLALGKACDDLDDPARAMQHFHAAERIRRSISPFDAAAFDALVDRIIARFPPDRGPTAHGPADPTPILITGMPRSGTTLTEQILSSHPSVAGGGELGFWNERGLAWLHGAPGPPTNAALDDMRSQYLSLLHAIAPGAARITDKLPFNFLWAGLIHLAFPQATIIACRRSAIDTAVSIHQTNFNRHVPFPTGGPELVAYIRAHRRITDHWRAVLPPGRYIEVEYESLTAAPEPEIRRLVAACGLPWDEACLAPERHTRSIRTASRWQARQPITAAAGRWRRYAPHLGALAELLDP